MAAIVDESLSSLVEVFFVATNVLAQAKVELAIFSIALCLHTLFVTGRKLVETRAVSYRGKAPLIAKKHAAPRFAKALEAATELARVLRPLLGSRAGQDEAALLAAFGRTVDSFRSTVAGHEVEVSLCLLETLSKDKVSAALLSAIRTWLRKRGCRMSARLGGMMLKAYASLGDRRDFEDMFQEVKALEKVDHATLDMLAFSVALSDGDLPAARERLRGIATAWHDLSGSVSAAPAQLLCRLATLASERGVLPDVVEDLLGMGLLAPQVLETALVEFRNKGEMPAFRNAVKLAEDAGTQFTAQSFSLCIGAAESPAEALALLKRAVEKDAASSEVLVAALDVAASHADRELLASVLQRLPPCPTADVAAALVNMSCLDFARGDVDTHDAVLEVYEKYLSQSDFSTSDASVFSASSGLRRVVDAVLHRKRPELLQQVITKLSDKNAQVAVIKSLAADSRLDEAATVFKALAEPLVSHYNAFLDACVACRDYRVAAKVFAQATNAGKADVVTYNTMIKAHLRDGSTTLANQVVNIMRGAGVNPNVVTFNELLDNAVRTHDMKAIWRLLEEMRSESLRPNHVTCSILLKSVRQGSHYSDVERVMSAVDEMTDEVDEVLLSSLLEACIRSGVTSILKRQLAQLRDGSRRVQVFAAQGYGSVIRANGIIGDLEGVRRSWDEMRSRGVALSSITLGCMVEALVTNGDVEGAYTLCREMMADGQTRPLVNAIIYCSVLKGFSHQKDMARVWSVYEEMLKAELTFSIVTYNTLVDACARNGDMDRITSLLHEMVTKGIEPNVITYSAIIKGYCQAGRMDTALELLDDMRKNKHLRPDEHTYNTLLSGCARRCMYKKGMEILAEMQENGITPSNFTLSVVVSLAQRSKGIDAAFAVCSEMSEKHGLYPNIHVYNNLLQACVSHHELDRALSVLVGVLEERVRPDARTYTILIRGFVAAQRAQDAAGLLCSAAGIRDAHARLAHFGSSAKCSLSSDFISEVLQGISQQCGDQRLAMELLRDLRRQPGLRLNSLR